MRAEPSSPSSDFGELLRRFRLAAGLSQEALAERAGVSLHGISALERGYRRNPQRETLALLLRALDLPEHNSRLLEAAARRPSTPRRRGVSNGTVQRRQSTRDGLPLPLATFVGRAAEMAQIAALTRESRLVTLTGAGGVGKTQTALRVAASFDGTSFEAVTFIALAPVGSASSVASAIVAAFGLNEAARHTALEVVLTYLQHRSQLLVIDNCEHVVDEARGVAEAILTHCADVRILATSREPLHAAGERAYRLPSLSPSDAGALFRDRARAVDARFATNDRNAAHIDELCRRLDRIPLAIELAAARVNVLSVEQIIENLDDRFRILSSRERVVVPRQQTMHATIDWSYELLEQRERLLFERLSVFAGGFTLELAADVCAGEGIPPEDVFELLCSLADKSLLVADLEASEPRYLLLESFREYAGRQLLARGDEGRLARRHAAAAVELAATFALIYERDPNRWGGRRLREDSDNFRKALHWSLAEQGDVLLGQRLTAELVNSYLIGAVEARRWVRMAAEHVDATTPAQVVASLTLAEATVARNLIDYRGERAASEEALRRFIRLGDALGIARARSRLGRALLFLGHREQAKEVLAEGLLAARRTLGFASGTVGDLLRMSALANDDDIAVARRFIAEALDVFETLEDRGHVPHVLVDLGACEFAAGNAAQALACAEEALASTEMIPETIARIDALSDASVYLIALQRFDEAKLRAKKALRAASEQRLDVHALWNVHHIAAASILAEPPGPALPQSSHRVAGRLLGFVAARLAQLGSVLEPTHRQEHARSLAALGGSLAETADVADLLAEGRTLTLDRAIEEAYRL